VLGPLQARGRALQASLDHERARARPARGAPSLGKLDKLCVPREGEAPTDWLAKLYGISVATGVRLQSATYRSPEEKTANEKIQRYEMVLPMPGQLSAATRVHAPRARRDPGAVARPGFAQARAAAGAVQAELRQASMVKP
jgi:hypothetical protein